jgi:hypothetical protein
MILEVSGIGGLDIGFVQDWIQRFQALEGALRKPFAVILFMKSCASLAP